MATGRLEGPLPAVLAVVGDLSTWPRWLDVVLLAEAEKGSVPPAWRARLGFRIGPLALGVDLRMVQTGGPPADPQHLAAICQPTQLRFERVERDRRKDHSPVTIHARLEPDAVGVTLALEMEVGKGIPLLNLQRELDRRTTGSLVRLQALVNEWEGGPESGRSGRG